MRCRMSRGHWLWLLLIASVLYFAACSTQRQDQQDGMAVNTDDPFNDPFFTQPPAWDDSVLQQSEVLTAEPEEPEQPKTFVEKSEGVIVSTLIVGASLAKIVLLPFIGF
ncbi:MAG: hypothetical protein AB7P69_14670 [Candidatus Binatia bacterium]